MKNYFNIYSNHIFILFKFINNHENNMKLHKFILVLNLVVGADSITNDEANAQQEFKRFVHLKPYNV